MRERIQAHYPQSAFARRDAESIFIADFSRRTDCRRAVEVHVNRVPPRPDDPTRPMDCLSVVNNDRISIDFNIFDDGQFRDNSGRPLKHCEGCFFPSVNNHHSWIAMFELKDCSPRNIGHHRAKAITQIITATQIFRQKNIITAHKVYGIISIPRKKTSFDASIIATPQDFKRFKDRYKVLLIPANAIRVASNNRLAPIY